MSSIMARDTTSKLKGNITEFISLNEKFWPENLALRSSGCAAP